MRKKKCLFVYLFTIILMLGCTEMRKDNVGQDNKKDIKEGNSGIEYNNATSVHEEEIERTYIDLNYLGSMENIIYRMRYIELEIDPFDEIAWWNHYTIDEYIASSKYYNFILPDEVDSEKHDIIISFGHKLKYLYYYEKDYLSDPEWGIEGYCARPIFEEEYIQGSAYIYLIDKIDLADSELASEDMSKFMKGDIPFELPPLEDVVDERK